MLFILRVDMIKKYQNPNYQKETKKAKVLSKIGVKKKNIYFW